MKDEAMAAHASTAQIQEWAQVVITTDGEIDEALGAASTATGLPGSAITDLTLPSETLSERERLEIYRDMYLIRMRDALIDDYPSTLDFLGWDAFEQLVADYVRVYPSRSFTLNHLGDHLPEYVKSASNLERRDVLADLTRLELEITQIFHADESQALSVEAVAAIPPDAWNTARLKPIAALGLLSLRHAVTRYHEAARADSPRPKIPRKRTYVVVYRKDYSVYHIELSAAEYELLSAVVAGERLGDAVAKATRGMKPQAAETIVFKCFSEWVARGFFTSVEY